MTAPADRPKRRRTRKARAAAYWADRLAAAPTAEARAAVAWDHARTRIESLPDDVQGQTWDEVVELLTAIAPANSQRKFAREFAASKAPTPRRARSGAHTRAYTREGRHATSTRSTDGTPPRRAD